MFHNFRKIDERIPMITRSEELVLLMVWKLEEEAYSVKIRKLLKEVTGKFWSFGAVYMPLDRLTKRGLLESYLADPTSERGGRSKRIYKPTREGLKALAEIKKIQKAAWEGIPEMKLGKL
jgi:DNA-binding PadR family transcriptional regulator